MQISHDDGHALLPRSPRDTAATLTGNTSGAGATAREEPVVPVPAWGEAVRVWGGGWPLHVYGFSALFFIQVLLASAILVRFRQRVRRLRPVLNTTCLLVLVGLLRFLFLVLDPYGSQGHVAQVMMGVLSQVAYPLLCAVYALIQLLLLRLTRLDVGKSRLRSKSVLFGMTLTYLFCIVLAEVLAHYERRARLLLLLDHSFFMAWALYLCVSFICNGFRLSQYAAETQRVRKELTNFYSSRRSQQTDMCMSRSSTSLRLSRPKLKITDEDQMTITIATDVDSSTSVSAVEGCDKDRTREKDRDKDRIRERDRFKDRERMKEKDKEKGVKLRDRDWSRLRDREKEKHREGDVERDKDRDKSEDRGAVKDRDGERAGHRDKRRKYKKLSQLVRSSKCHEVVFDNSRLVEADCLPACLSEHADENDDNDDAYPLMEETSPEYCTCKSRTCDSHHCPVHHAFSMASSANSKSNKFDGACEKKKVKGGGKFCDNDLEEVFFRPVREKPSRLCASETGDSSTMREAEEEEDDDSHSTEEDRVRSFKLSMQKLPDRRPDSCETQALSSTNQLPLLDFKSTSEYAAKEEISDRIVREPKGSSSSSSSIQNRILCLFGGSVRKEAVVGARSNVTTTTRCQHSGHARSVPKTSEYRLLKPCPSDELPDRLSFPGENASCSKNAAAAAADARCPHNRAAKPGAISSSGEGFGPWSSAGGKDAGSEAAFGCRSSCKTYSGSSALDVVSESTDARSSSSLSSRTHSSDGRQDSCDTTQSVDSAADTPVGSHASTLIPVTLRECREPAGGLQQCKNVPETCSGCLTKPGGVNQDLVDLSGGSGVQKSLCENVTETTAKATHPDGEDPWSSLMGSHVPRLQTTAGDLGGSACCQSGPSQDEFPQASTFDASCPLPGLLGLALKSPEEDTRCDLCQAVEEGADSRVPLLASVSGRLPGNRTTDPDLPCTLETGYLADTEVMTHHHQRHNLDRRHRRCRQTTSQNVTEDVSETEECVGMTPSLSATFSATIRTQPSSIGLFRIRQSAMVQRAVQLTYALTFLLLFACLLQLYAAFGSYGVLAPSSHPDPWPWYAFQTLFRFTEVAIGFTSVGVVFIVLNHRNARARRKPPPRSAMLDCVV